MKYPFTLLVLLAMANHAFGTHILGGYIQAKRVSPTNLTFEFTVNLFTDNGAVASSEQTIRLCTGEANKTVVADRVEHRSLDQMSSINIYRITYTYQTQGTYTIAASLTNRTSGARNLSNAETPFYIQTTFSTAVTNTTPAFAYPENGFKATTQQAARFNLKGADTEGDSVVYSVTRPKLAECTQPEFLLPSYVFPNDVARRGTFKIDLQGVLDWNAPTEQGRYVFAVVAEEWRNGQKISETLFDMLLIVEDRPGGTPGTIPPYEPVANQPLITGTQEEVSDGEVSILAYPIPVQDRLHIRLKSPQPSIARMQLFNVQGQMVREIDLVNPSHEHEISLDTGQWVPGTYLLRTYTHGKTYTHKVLKR
ncbi:T9SS type A sorting domain-containing protein [Tellurirhabdus bombi]|uniref:T9SS type A sorting domain-containing protein n=1 Tax=Tellurirhabdus bombi TaxID=2907205 RepID=UPI001F17FF9D|nr:T9SS type A sorting domain-containing protein [Tellurirhabdus bombi]